MIRRLIARLRGPWVADAPASDLGSLDVANGMGRRLSDDAPRACKDCGWTPHDGERVVGACVPGYHDIALVGWPTADERRDGWLPSERQERLSREDERPTGEVPPMTDQQAARLMADLYRGCPVCSWVPPHPRFRVLTHLPNGAHYSRSMDAPDVPVYDQDMPFASEVEAWLAGGAK